MKKKPFIVLASAALACGLFAGCSSNAQDSTAEDTATAETEQAEVSDDQAAADEVAALIDAIYVQERTDETDAQCEAAKAGWDALTDEQKALVEG